VNVPVDNLNIIVKNEDFNIEDIAIKDEFIKNVKNIEFTI
jgi:hypothetical protein